jgi:hypothetical protein
MLVNVDNLQINQKVDIPFYVGTEPKYGTHVVRTALEKKLGSLEGYQFVPGESGYMKFIGEGPYSKARLFGAIKQSILERVRKKYSKFRSLVSDKL